MSISAIGQDSHRFLPDGDPAAKNRPLVLGGVVIGQGPPLEGNSDADVVLHALTNAISGLCGEPVLGEVADAMCRSGIADSRAYVSLALSLLGDIRLTHLSFSIEAKRPHLTGLIDRIREEIAGMVKLPVSRVAVTATTGEGLTSCGRGEGITCLCIASAVLPLQDHSSK
ncbi:MAG: 2-C-methyl-D-erythritol 2,4-cyclodiphosphate synthase [Clostridiaceae bacterium]|nr:2-C-methyl-D-erythritol 2,4-cyclodiphosphate synthase [Clostridiaceae bacterium]